MILIGDYLDLEKEEFYPCSDGSLVVTVDVDNLVSAVRQDTLRGIEEL